MCGGTLIRCLLPLMLFAVAESAVASIYRCESADGKISFSDQPCPSGDSGLLDEFERDRSPVVEGKFTRDGRTLDPVDGAACWSNLGGTLNLVLVPRKLLPTEKDRLRSGDFGWLRKGGMPGHVRIELLLDSPEDLNSLRQMRTVVIGLNEKPDIPWTSNHGRSEIPRKVSKLELQQFDGRQLIEFESAEISEYIRWSVSLRLPLRRAE